jgi:hypothetical protein
MDIRPAILERPAPAEQRISADEAMRKTERFLNRRLGHLLAAGTPQRVPFPLPPTSIVPGIHLGAKKPGFSYKRNRFGPQKALSASTTLLVERQKPGF